MNQEQEAIGEVDYREIKWANEESDKEILSPEPLDTYMNNMDTVQMTTQMMNNYLPAETI